MPLYLIPSEESRMGSIGNIIPPKFMCDIVEICLSGPVLIGKKSESIRCREETDGDSGR